MVFAIACGGVGSHDGFKFQIEYFAVLKKALSCVIWMVVCKIKFLLLSKRCVSFVTLSSWVICNVWNSSALELFKTFSSVVCKIHQS